MYKYFIVTHVPAFYKINLYNELSKKINIFVVFISNNTNESRAKDFTGLNGANFNYKVLNEGCFQERNKLKSVYMLNAVLNKVKFEKIIVNGWDLWEFWYLVLVSPYKKNFLLLESTVMESCTSGIKGLLKKIFLSRVCSVFAPGKPHAALLKKMEHKGQIRLTKGVGIINKPFFDYLNRSYNKKFLFIGRLSKVKNLEILIRVFNNLDEFELTIIGEGEDGDFLKNIANKNIIFKGAIQNKFMQEYYLSNDVLILPSMSETWGLVTEEAIFFGMPVIISKKCGSSELIQDSVNGYLIDPDSAQSIRSSILKIDQKGYLKLCSGVMQFSIDKKDEKQVNAYL